MPSQTVEQREASQQAERAAKLAHRQFPVAEVFGPTVQGEGPDAGTPCFFVRFGGCDYRCGWSDHAAANAGAAPDGGFVCDSLHAVLPGYVRAVPRLTAEQIMLKLHELRGFAAGPSYVVFSGGNPALHHLDLLVETLHDFGWTIAVETQGSLWKDWLAACDRVVVSPKPPASKQSFDLAALALFLSKLSKKKAVLKVPILDAGDLMFADTLFEHFPAHGRYLSVTNDWRKPNTTDELLERYRWIIEQAQMLPFTAAANVMPQLHVLAWGNERAR